MFSSGKKPSDNVQKGGAFQKKKKKNYKVNGKKEVSHIPSLPEAPAGNSMEPDWQKWGQL